MKQLVVFDLDGTLLDTLADIHWALNSALATAGMATHSMDSVRVMVGHGLSELIRKAIPLEQNDPALHDQVLGTMRTLYGKNPFTRTKPYPGIPELLKTLQERTILLAVLTNKAEPIAQTIVEHFFPGVFVVVQGETPTTPRKPHPDALLGLVRKITDAPVGSDSVPVETVMIGDSEADIQTAKSAGIRAIGVSWGFRTALELRDAGADCVVDSCDKLLSEICKPTIPSEP